MKEGGTEHRSDWPTTLNTVLNTVLKVKLNESAFFVQLCH